MASSSSTRTPEVIRGGYLVPLADLGPVVCTAQEGTGMKPGLHTMHSGLYWRLIYLFTPQRVKVGQAEWRDGQAAQAFLIPHYTVYRLDGRRTEAAHHVWLMLQNLDETPLVAMAQNPAGCAVFDDPTGLLARRMQAVVGAAERLERRAFWPMQYALRPVLRSLERAMPAGEGVFEVTSGPATTMAETLVPGVVAHLQRRLAEPVSIAEIAADLRLSVSSVSHVYHKLVGETPMQTLRRLRIHRLKVLLAEGWTLDAAANGTGFCDAHHASREFKRSEGMTPSGFLRTLRDATG